MIISLESFWLVSCAILPEGLLNLLWVPFILRLVNKKGEGKTERKGEGEERWRCKVRKLWVLLFLQLHKLRSRYIYHRCPHLSKSSFCVPFMVYSPRGEGKGAWGEEGAKGWKVEVQSTHLMNMHSLYWVREVLFIKAIKLCVICFGHMTLFDLWHNMTLLYIAWRIASDFLGLHSWLTVKLRGWGEGWRLRKGEGRGGAKYIVSSNCNLK